VSADISLGERLSGREKLTHSALKSRQSLPLSLSPVASWQYYTGSLRRIGESGSAKWLSGQGEGVSISTPFAKGPMSRRADQDRKVAKASERIHVTVAEKTEPADEGGALSKTHSKGGFLGSLKRRTTREKDDEEAQGC
jgi:hypothetical protein